MSVVAAGALAFSRAAVTHASWLADDTDVGDETHKAGPIAILVVAILCVACFVLFRSMTKHLRRVREDFPDDGTAGAEAAPAVSAPTDVDAPHPSAGHPRAAPKSRPRAVDDPASR